jgi:CRISPR-associated endonuclease/helicase Cas3
MDPSQAIAHVAADGRLHYLIEHLEGTARRAKEAAQGFNSEAWAELAGLWHDLGKHARAFQDMIRSAAGLEAHLETPAGRVDHSTAGALLAIRRFGSGTGQPLAFVIAGHHAGLADKTDLDCRLEQKQHLLDLALNMAGTTVAEATRPAAPAFLRPVPTQEAEDLKRSYEFWVRMLFSTLVDADFLDTEEFHEGGPQGARPRHRSVGEPLPDLKVRFDNYMAEKQRAAATDFSRSTVNRVRDRVLRNRETITWSNSSCSSFEFVR